MPVQDDPAAVEGRPDTDAATPSPDARGQRRRLPSHLAWAAVILVVALAARSLWVAYAPSDPMDGRIFSDPVFYYYSAAHVADGGGYIQPLTGADTAYWPPGYTFLLTGLFKVFGAHVSIAWGVNIVLGALTCVALYYLGRLVAGWRTGVTAGLLLALFPGHVFFSSLVLSEVTFTFLVVVALLLAALAIRRGDGRARWLLLLLGVTIGAAALVRGQGLFLLPLAALFWWLQSDWRRALRSTALAAVAAVVVIAPWTVRNYFVMDSFIPISTNIGGNLYVGNFDGATGHMVPGAGEWARDRYSYLPPKEQEVAMNNRLLREGLKFMFTHPGREVELTASKVRGLYEDDEEALRGIPNRQAGETIPHAGRIADVANAYYFAVLALAGGGLLVWLRRPRSALILPLLAVAVFTLGQLPFFTDPRFHYPMLPAFALLAAAGVVGLFDTARRFSGSRVDSHDRTGP
jgi:4-amino-4-deoxy-L-arabinose transferase-like glycosyltransferase